MTMTNGTEPLFRLEGVYKSFGAVQALTEDRKSVV